MAKADKKKKKGNVINVDFSGVKTFKTIPEQNYLVEVTSCEEETSSNKNPMLSWEFEVAEGKHKGAKLWYTTVLNKDSLWKLREVLEALGQEVPDDEMDLDLTELVGMQCGVNVLHEEYEGKMKAKIADFISKDDVDAGEDDSEEDEPKGKKSSKKDEEETPDVSEMDEDELKEFVEESGLDVDLEDYGSIKKKRAAVEAALEGGAEEEEKSETYTEDAVNDMSEKELKKLIKKHELDVEIDDEKLKKQRKIVLEALSEAELIED